MNYTSPACTLGNGKHSLRRGAWTLFHGILTHGRKDVELQSFYKLKN